MASSSVATVDFSVVQVHGVGNVAIATLKNPPVNALGYNVRLGLLAAAEKVAADKSLKVLVIRGAGDAFCAGADISEFSKELKDPHLSDVINKIDMLDIPTVAAIHGVAFGGGLEVALGCNYRVALSSAKLALPEVQLGIIPGAGGTQRLPRVIGVQKALEMITTGKPVTAIKSKEMGIVDHVVEHSRGANSPSDQVLKAALEFITAKHPLIIRRIRDLPIKNELGDAIFDAAVEKTKKQARGFLGPLFCIEAVKASTQFNFEEGLVKESELISKAFRTPEARAQQYLFFAERQAAKNGIPNGGKPSPIRSLGVIGAGTMGAGIAINFLLIGISVVLVESKQEFLDAGIGRIQASLTSYVKRGILKKEQAEKVAILLKPSLSYDDLANVDMVIEAVFENMALKKEIFQKLDTVCKREALLCTNTSTLDVDEIASSTTRPDKVIGTHFFSPANIMKLLEIVKGRLTSPDTISSTVAIGKKIKKVCVVVGNCDGFVGNRMLFPYGEQASFLLEEGATPQQIDRVIHNFGFAVGPFSMWDIAGNDVGWRIRQSKAHLRDPTHRYSKIADRLCEKGRFGQKTGLGWYKYEKGSRRGIPDAQVDEIIKEAVRETGTPQRTISDDEILHRCLLPLVNEGFKILDEGIASSPSDIDVIWVYGYSWPVFRGGPMHYADSLGLPTVLRLLEGFAREHPNEPQFRPSPLLYTLVDKRLSLGDFWAQRTFDAQHQPKL